MLLNLSPKKEKFCFFGHFGQIVSFYLFKRGIIESPFYYKQIKLKIMLLSLLITEL